MSEYIEKGSYGCIIKPNLKCDGLIGNDKYITKFFFNKSSYLIEKENHEKIEKIDKKNIFTVKKKSNCKILLTPEIKKKIKNVNICNFKSNIVYQITYEYGGIDLIHIFKKNINDLLKINLFIFLQKFSNIFDGLSKINQNKLIHFDVKINNILYDFKKNKFNIIDFGIINKINKYHKYIHNLIYNPHPIYPNDINILSYIIDGYFYKDLNNYNLNSNEFVLLIDNDIKFLNIFYKDKKNPYFKKVIILINDIYNYFKIDMFKNFDSTMFENIYLKKIKLSKVYKDFGNKIDVYMLGLLLFNLLLFIFKYLHNNPSIKKIPLELFSLIKKMIVLNPYDRLTIQEASIEFKSIMKKNKKYLVRGLNPRPLG